MIAELLALAALSLFLFFFFFPSSQSFCFQIVVLSSWETHFEVTCTPTKCWKKGIMATRMFLQLVEILLTLSDCHFEWESKHILIRVLQAAVFFSLCLWQKKRSANCSVWSHVWGLSILMQLPGSMPALRFAFYVSVYITYTLKTSERFQFLSALIIRKHAPAFCPPPISHYIQYCSNIRPDSRGIEETHVVNEYVNMLLNWD